MKLRRNHKFTRCYNRLNAYTLNEEAKDIVTKFDDLKIFWDGVQSAHYSHLFTIYPGDNAEVKREEEEW